MCRNTTVLQLGYGAHRGKGSRRQEPSSPHGAGAARASGSGEQHKHRRWRLASRFYSSQVETAFYIMASKSLNVRKLQNIKLPC